MRKKIHDRKPSLTFAEVGKALGAAWKACGHKEHYLKLAAADKKRAEREREAFQKSRPKRAISAYMFFVKENRASVSVRVFLFATFCFFGWGAWWNVFWS